MRHIWKELLNVFFGGDLLPGWKETIDEYGIRMIIKDIVMKDDHIRCVGVSSGFVVIYAGSCEDDPVFFRKPMHYIIIVNEQSLGYYLRDEKIREVLEVHRRLTLSAS